jgi:hypothetical protein
MLLAWSLGFPGWQIAARAGVPIRINIHVSRDDEAGVFFATSPHVRGLAVESETLDGLRQEVKAALPELLMMDYRPVSKPRAILQYDECLSPA